MGKNWSMKMSYLISYQKEDFSHQHEWVVHCMTFPSIFCIRHDYVYDWFEFHACWIESSMQFILLNFLFACVFLFSLGPPPIPPPKTSTRHQQFTTGSIAPSACLAWCWHAFWVAWVFDVVYICMVIIFVCHLIFFLQIPAFCFINVYICTVYIILSVHFLH